MSTISIAPIWLCSRLGWAMTIAYVWSVTIWLMTRYSTSFTSTNIKLRKPSPDFHLTFTWASDHHYYYLNLKGEFKLHLNFTWTSPELHLNFNWASPELHLTFTWPSPDPLTFTLPLNILTFPWPLPNLKYQFTAPKKLYGGWVVVGQLITDLTSGSTFDFSRWPWP